MQIHAIDPADSRARQLLAELDQYLRDLYPPGSNHIDDLETLSKPNVVFAVAERSAGEDDGAGSQQTEMLGCGAVKILHDDLAGIDYGEIKRVYVSRIARGQGEAHKLMEWLEQAAINKGAVCLRLETGIHQPEAIALYKSRGYRTRGAFPGYFDTDNTLSLFMEKSSPI